MKNTEVLKRLLGYLKAHWLRLALVMVSAILSTAFMVLAPFVVGKVTTTLFDSIADGTFYWKKIIWLLSSLVALYLISQLFTFLQGFVMAKITSKVMETLRREINEKMHRLKLDYYDTHTHGDILSIITNDVDTINNTISQNLTSIVTQVATAVGVLLMMIAISPVLSLIPIVMVPLSLFSAAGVMKASEKHYRRQQELLGQLNGYVEEMYNGQSVVQTFNYQKRAKEEFAKLNEDLKISSQKAETTAGTVSPITTLVNDLGYVLCAAIGCLWAIVGKITVGNVQAMLEYTWRFAEPFSAIAGMVGSFSAACAAGNRIFSLMDAEEEVPDPEECVVLQKNSGSVTFQNVSFGYTPDRMLMKNINLTVKPGQKVAVVGPTGAENISQGERQLLTIARVIAADPEIMILDEATSNVDTHTEVLIQKAMAELMKGRTSFVIAHRLSTIRDADMILYMEDGDIKEVGNHEELMEKKGKYAALYMSQFVSL